MSSVRIDFSAFSPWRELVRLGRNGWLLAVGSLALMIALGAGYGLADAGIAKREAELARLQAIPRTPGHAAGDTALTLPEAQAKAINQTVLQLNLPWSELLDALEKATPASVALLELNPDPKRRVFKGVAEAKDVEAMITYMARLKQQAAIAGAILTRHEVRTGGPQKPLLFEFEAVWKEQGR